MPKPYPQHCLLRDHNLSKPRWPVLCVLVNMLWLVLAGCQTSYPPAPRYVNPEAIPPAVSFTHIENYTTHTENDSIDPAQQQQLQRIAQLIDQHELTIARQQLNSMDRATLHGLQRPYHLLDAKWYLTRKEPWKAINILQDLEPPQTHDPLIQANYHRLLAQAYALNNQNLSAIRTRLQLEPWLQQDEQQANHMAIWQTAQEMTSTQLKQALTASDAPELVGWLQLASIEKQAQLNHHDWMQALQTWQAMHPQHPGQAVLTLPTSTTNQQPHHIAVLLPQTGAMAPAGKAIARGIMLAYYQTQTTPSNTTLTFIDTAEGAITDHYQQALAKGADFVIGPLAKTDIHTLASQKAFTLPSIVLNNISEPIEEQQAAVVQFGLSPIDEAQQIASRAWHKGHRQALLIYPDDAWGQQIAASFEHDWQTLGGQISDHMAFSATDQLDTHIKSLLGIDASEARIMAMQKSLGGHIKTSPRHRDDIDCVILLTTARQTQTIYPLLKFYYLGALPAYALAQTNPGYARSPNFYRDLDQINVPTSLWVVAPTQLPKPLPQWKAALQKKWPQSFKEHQRLYALGIDAYQLSQQWSAITTFHGFELQGATGRLNLTEDHHLHRALRWASIQANRVNLLNR